MRNGSARSRPPRSAVRSGHAATSAAFSAPSPRRRAAPSGSRRPSPGLRRRRPARLLGTAAAALLVLVALPGCSGDDGGDSGYRLPSEKLRESEKAVKGKAGRSADMRFTVIGFREGMTEVMGTHAAMGAHGTFTRIRLLAANEGRDIQVFDTWKQRLLTSDGKSLSPDVNATMVKRQPERLSVGAAMRAEFDLWFDVPKGVKVKGVQLFGSPPVGAVTDPAPVRISLP
ncbi:DUF4352 domain-containing protein [Actinomadura sp. J1-007]|uniref:DUF4352 domain-containing protein n=1 Tax=Actinomadura sp. J1-007 TaxID=2661913 RepID=UPI00132182C5|nr:DUF4352 domain-containing protein [Actinomadura sp. J1-007]MWK37971.1 DUF4352 domain-containing protein [Actinomadura sp. J1-007]